MTQGADAEDMLQGLRLPPVSGGFMCLTAGSSWRGTGSEKDSDEKE